MSFNKPEHCDVCGKETYHYVYEADDFPVCRECRIEHISQRFEHDKIEWLKNRTSFNSKFPYTFPDYVEKYADDEAKEYWYKKVGIMEA